MKHIALILSLLVMAGTATAQDGANYESAAVVIDKAHTEDSQTFSVNAGGFWNTGNTESYQANAGADFALFRGAHGFKAQLLGQYARQLVRPNTSFETSAENIEFNSRYNYFMTPMDSVFARLLLRYDPFAGYDLRIQGDAGYERYLIKQATHKWSVYAGYSMTHDILVNNLGENTVHALLLGTAYENKLSKMLTYTGSFEAYINIEETEDTRIIWRNAVALSVIENLAIQVGFNMLWDNVPAIATAQKTDTQTTVSLLYTFL